MVLAAFGSGLYKTFLWLHILSAIVGFGSVMLNGIYGAQAKKRGGPGALAIIEANLAVTKIAEYAIYAVFVFGIALLITGNDVWEFSDTWVSIAMLLYIIALGISHAIMFPNAKKMQRLVSELVNAGPPPAGAGGPPPQVAQMEQAGKMLGIFGTVLNVMLLVILYLMVFKPGA